MALGVMYDLAFCREERDCSILLSILPQGVLTLQILFIHNNDNDDGSDERSVLENGSTSSFDRSSESQLI